MTDETVPEERRIPVTEEENQVIEQTLAEEAVGEMVLNEVIDPRESNRIDDVEKAHDMAIAGDEFRTRAAENRDVEKQREKSRGAMQEYKDANDEKDPSILHPIARAELRHRRSEARDKKNHERNEFDRKNAAGASTKEEDSRLGKEVYKTDLYSDPKERAEAFDRRADKLEEWAGILHDNPMESVVFDGYVFEPTPETMLRVEEMAKFRDELLDHYKWEHLTEPRKEVGLSTAIGVHERNLEILMDKLDEDEQKEVDALLSELNDKNEALRTKLIELHHEKIVVPMEAENNLRNEALADIRAGAQKSETIEQEETAD